MVYGGREENRQAGIEKRTGTETEVRRRRRQHTGTWLYRGVAGRRDREAGMKEATHAHAQPPPSTHPPIHPPTPPSTTHPPCPRPATPPSTILPTPTTPNAHPAPVARVVMVSKAPSARQS
ncbi:hypothetical protein NPIL_188431 [Nephila pilipes]|uniref:Uncharacterized protein n=1 Tax=Nephila pilipes TaxID=299642 RepID=A0A8X6PT57_NEPPI|nr:hypothetical protein NPIL_188431 [Nephila pilipes]